jgi:hypothetical protein
LAVVHAAPASASWLWQSRQTAYSLCGGVAGAAEAGAAAAEEVVAAAEEEAAAAEEEAVAEEEAAG